MLDTLLKVLSDPVFWKYISIPFVAAVVGWVTNWVAIQMTFLPIEFIGRRPYLGWQGIIPSKAEKMATIFADSAMLQLGTLPELFDEMEPERIARHVNGWISPRIDEWIGQALFWSGYGPAWNLTPSLLRGQIRERVQQRLPEVLRRMLHEASERIEELLDFKHMLVHMLSRNKPLLNRLFQESGSKEFQFIVRSGLYFGFPFGLVQLAVWVFLPAWWVLPLFGLLVGWVTNWIALNLVFRPLHPRRIGPWTLQGLFLKRQNEVAAVWCRMVTREIITVRQLFEAMLSGPRSEEARKLIRGHMEPLADEALGLLRPAAGLMVGSRGLDRIRQSVGDKAIEVALEPFGHWPFIEERAEVIERMLRERMEAMPAEQFQALLRPCFQEDEMKLILTGAVLGFLAGLAQLVFVFGGG